MRHSVSFPLGPVPPNSGNHGDQVYLVPSNFRNWLSCGHCAYTVLPQTSLPDFEGRRKGEWGKKMGKTWVERQRETGKGRKRKRKGIDIQPDVTCRPTFQRRLRLLQSCQPASEHLPATLCNGELDRRHACLRCCRAIQSHQCATYHTRRRRATVELHAATLSHNQTRLLRHFPVSRSSFANTVPK